MSPNPTYVVLDTNILLLDADNLFRYPDSIIVIPDIVIKELDTKKTIQGELGYQARKTSRLLMSAQYTIAKTTEYVIAIGTNPHFTVQIVKPLSYPDSAETNDDKIVHVAKTYTSIDPSTQLITNDTNCYLSAIIAGVNSTDLKVVDRTEFSFTSTLDVAAESFDTLNGQSILLLNPEHQSENYNYIFTNSTTGVTKLGVVYDNIIHIIDKEVEDKLRKQDVSPIGAEQLFFSYAIQEPSVDVVVCDARAGTGKTLVALSNAIALMNQNNNYKQILYVRASVDDVEKAEEVGFLSGNDEKMAVYYSPLHDSIDFIVRSKYKNSRKKGQELEDYISEKKQEFMSKYNIQFMTGLGMRGRTFPDSVVIIDEFQNNSQSSAQKMITRAGNNTKYILIGSQRQIDNAYITKYNNALSVVLDAAAKPSSTVRLHAINLRKVVRSKLTDWAESLFSKENL